MQTRLPFFGLVRASGDDAAAFLHNQLSNDIQNLAPGQACYATYNTPKGRVIANMLVLNRGEVPFYEFANDGTLIRAFGDKSLFRMAHGLRFGPGGEMWVTDKYPPDYSWKEDRAKTKVGLIPPHNGTIFRIVDFPPIKPEVEKMDLNTMMKVVGDHAPAKGVPVRHPMMHRTRSLDYAIIMSGEIDMLLATA